VLASPAGGLMTSTISRPANGQHTRDGRPDQHGEAQGGRGLRLPERHDLRMPAIDKIRPPRPSVPLLERPRVTELIAAATARHRVTLVCGPSGAGKTVACAAWATSAQARRVGWVSLDYGDRWPLRLWGHVRLALAGTVPGEIARELPDPEDEAFALRLARAAERLNDPVTLVVDDISELAGASVLTGVDQLIRHAPPALRLILSGRHPAGLAVAKLRVSGELAEIGASDLACTPEEAEAYFRLAGMDLSDAQRDELLARTQGWITGLRLAAMRGGPGRLATSVTRITGDEPTVADYLWDEVLASLPPDSRLFLLRTSVADAICGDLADALTGGSSGGAILDQLSRENMMIRPADAEFARTDRTEYCYHPMLIDMLRARLRRELPGESVRLTRRAARWLAARGRHAQAIRTAARAGDWDFAGRVLADAGPELLVPEPAADLEPVLASFPSSRFSGDPAVAGALAAAGLRTGDTCTAALHLDNAQQALGRCGQAQRQRIRTWLQALRLMSAADPGLVEQSRGIAVQAEHAASDAPAHQGVGLLWTALGVAELVSMDAANARQSLAAAGRHLRDARPEFADRARGWLALAEAIYGNMVDASELTAPAGNGGADGQDPLAARLTSLAAAHVHLARDELAVARAALDRCEPDEPTASPDPVAGAVMSLFAAAVRTQLAIASGDLAAARCVLTRLRYRFLRAGLGQLTTATLDELLAPLEADIAARDSDLSGARLILTQAEQDRRPTDGMRLAQARLLLAQGDCEAAIAAIGPVLTDAPEVTLNDRIRALVTAAIAARRLGHADQAADWLTLAVTLAEPHGICRPFLDGGGAARSALTVLIRPTSHAAAFTARILQRFEVAPGPGGTSTQTAVAAVPLTSSELAVLRFLPSHMTNQEIAEALFLSINTVKTHLRSVYRKLGVTTRRQAIACGGKLGLL
jgi:LuxR family transcriptional regulator, maltose regulon positive regulatory protein